MITVTALVAFCIFKWNFADNHEDRKQFKYYLAVANLVKLNSEYYVDLFLLWLLYRFMKPKYVFKDGISAESAILFAHDSKNATELLFG